MNLDFVRRWTSTDKESVSVDKLDECVSNGISGASNSNRFHHAGVAKLSTTQLSVKQLKKKLIK